MSGTVYAERNDRWSQKIWREWSERYNKDHPSDPCPPDILQTAQSPAELQPWLIRFIQSFQERNGTSAAYKPNTLYSVLNYIQKHVRIFNPNHQNGSLKFLDRKNEGFKEFRDCLAVVNQHVETFGVERRHYDIFSADDEDTLWSKGILGTSSPLCLIHSLYYYNGKNLLLRRGEHQTLRFSQFKRLSSPERYEFERLQMDEVPSDQETEGGRPHSPITHSPVKKFSRRRVTCIRADPSAGLRCYVSLLDIYFTRIPPSVLERDLFYLYPVKNPTDTAQIWYSERSYGRNSLDRITKLIAECAGFSGHYTATSLQQTGRACSSSSITHHNYVYNKCTRSTDDSNGRRNKRQKLSETSTGEGENESISNGVDPEDDPIINDNESQEEEEEEEEGTFDEVPNHHQTSSERNTSSQPSLQFLGDLLFHGTQVKILSESKDAKTMSGSQEVSMGECRVTITPSQPVGVDIMRAAMQSSHEGQWQVVLIPPTQATLQQNEPTESTHTKDSEIDYNGRESSHISDEEEEELPSGAIFQYLNN